LLALEAGFTEAGREFSISYVYPSDKIVISHACDGIGVEMTEATMLKVERATGRSVL